MNNRVTGKIVRKLLGIFIFIFTGFQSYATHQVGGYISYKCLGGYTYQVTITDYTNTSNTTADRDTMRIWWGDGHYSLLTRLNGPTGIANVSYPNGDPYPNGEPICNYNFSVYPPAPLVDARKINIYQGTWTYDGPGTYHLWMDDPDRMANINNVTGSVNVDFYLFTTIVANEFTSGCVNSPVIANAPVCQYACAGECYTYNPGAYIPTPPSDANDSIVYSLGHSLALNPLNLQPEVCPGNNLIVPIGTTVEVDQHTGTLKWCNAQAGIWNFVILMTTMRRTYSIIGTDTTREIVPVDTVELELEVIVNGSCAFNPPSITSKDTCVVAGGDVQIKYTANAGANNLQLYITDAGEPFSLSPPAVLTGYAPPRSAMNPVFNWTTYLCRGQGKPLFCCNKSNREGYRRWTPS